MKALFRFAVLPLSLVGLAACTTMDEQSASYTPPTITVTSDGLYIAEVERIARRRGIDVVWINPPSKRVKTVATR